MSFKRISVGCVAAGALVLLAGCAGSSGSSNAKGASDPVGVSSSKPAASPSPTVTPATKAQLRKLVLQATDLPGWKASPSDNSDNSPDQDQAEFVACMGAKNTDPDQVATVDSDNYDLGNAEFSSSASSYKSQSDLDTDAAMLKSPKYVPCMTKQLQKVLATSMPDGAKLGTVSVKITPGPGTGPANVAGSGSATVPVSGPAGQLTVYLDFVYLTGPLIEAEVDAENIGAPVPAAVLQSVVEKLATRTADGG
jgi:hypothetical protein